MVDLKDVFVIEKVECAKCGGTGWVQHPFWEEYFKNSKTSSPEWFAKAAGYNEPPDEEMLCDECGGTGFRRRETPLTEILPSLAEAVSKEL